MTPKELLELADSEAGQDFFDPRVVCALRAYAELLSMMEFIDDTLLTNPRLNPVLVRELARDLGWESER